MKQPRYDKPIIPVMIEQITLRVLAIVAGG